jgi:hypothetical protein
LRDLLEAVEHRSKLLDTGRGEVGKALFHIAAWHAYWLRPVREWKPSSKNADRQLQSLHAHLFAKYPKELRAFWNNLWQQDTPDTVELSWYLHIAEGKNLRTHAMLPIPVTKAIAHLFLVTPNPLYRPLQQLRFAQLASLDVSPRHQQTLLLHRSSGFRFPTTAADKARTEALEQDRALMYQLVARNAMLDSDCLAGVLDYVEHERTRPREPGEGPFSMRKRTMEALIRQSAVWHRTMQKMKKTTGERWEPKDIAPYRYTATNVHGEPYGPVITITEITSVRELQLEGQKLHHCVGSYAHSCISGAASIWSMKMDGTRLVTLEMNGSKTIVQARGLCNRRMSANESTHILSWGKQTGVRLSGFL